MSNEQAARRKWIDRWLLFPIIFPLTVPCLWPGVLVLALYLTRGEPITLDRNQFECTESHLRPIGMAMMEVCDQWTRKR